MSYEKKQPHYGRFKDTPWFDTLNDSYITVFGAGGVGSYLTFFLNRAGANIIVVDMDTVDDGNLGLQN